MIRHGNIFFYKTEKKNKKEEEEEEEEEGVQSVLLGHNIVENVKLGYVGYILMFLLL